MLQQTYGLALDLMNQAVVMVTNYVPALIEKMKLQMAMHDWEQVVDSAQRSAVSQPLPIAAVSEGPDLSLDQGHLWETCRSDMFL